MDSQDTSDDRITRSLPLNISTESFDCNENQSEVKSVGNQNGNKPKSKKSRKNKQKIDKSGESEKLSLPERKEYLVATILLKSDEKESINKTIDDSLKKEKKKKKKENAKKKQVAIHTAATATVTGQKSMLHDYVEIVGNNKDLTIRDSSKNIASPKGFGFIVIKFGNEFVKIKALHVEECNGTYLCANDLNDQGVRLISVQASGDKIQKPVFALSYNGASIRLKFSNRTRCLPYKYILKPKTAEGQAIMTDESPVPVNLHVQFGHVDVQDIIQSIQHDTIVASDSQLEDLKRLLDKPCLDCLTTKGKESPVIYRSPDHHLTKDAFRTVYSDICEVRSNSKAGTTSYLISFRCALTGYTGIRELQDKFDAFTKIEEFFNWVANILPETNGTVHRFITDQDTAYLSKEAKKIYTNYGVEHYLSTTNPSLLNGRAERFNLTILNEVQTNLNSAKLPAKYWFYAAQHIVNLRNHVYQTTLKNSAWSYIGLTPTKLSRHHAIGETCVFDYRKGTTCESNTAPTTGIFLGFNKNKLVVLIPNCVDQHCDGEIVHVSSVNFYSPPKMYMNDSEPAYHSYLSTENLSVRYEYATDNNSDMTDDSDDETAPTISVFEDTHTVHIIRKSPDFEVPKFLEGQVDYSDESNSTNVAAVGTIIGDINRDAEETESQIETFDPTKSKKFMRTPFTKHLFDYERKNPRHPENEAYDDALVMIQDLQNNETIENKEIKRELNGSKDNDENDGDFARLKQNSDHLSHNKTKRVGLFVSTISLDTVPESYEKALICEESDFWRAAIKDELDSQKKLATWGSKAIITNDPEILKKTIDTKWVFTRKTNGLYKARLVARGDMQHSETYDTTCSPILRPEIVRTILATVASKNWFLVQADIKNASLNASIDKEVYIRLPQGVVIDQTVPEGETAVIKLKKALYGLKQASRLWSETLKKYLLKKGFESYHAFPSTYVLRDGAQVVAIIGVFVDDFLIATKSRKLSKTITWLIRQKFALKIIQPDKNGVQNFLGMDLKIESDDVGAVRRIKINQESYILKMIDQLGMKVSSSKPQTPLTPGFYFDPQANFLESMDDFTTRLRLFKQMIGSLLYISVSTRPDICYAVNYLARFATYPHSAIYHELVRVVDYLYHTRTLNLCYDNQSATCESINGNSLVCYSDSENNKELVTKKSMNGYLLYFCGAPIHWKSAHTESVSQSSTEAEVQALVSATNELQWLQALYVFIGAIEEKNKPNVYVSNEHAVATITNGDFSFKSKHQAVKLNVVRQRYYNKEFDIHQVRTEDQLADLLTKPVSTKSFEKLTSGMFVYSIQC